MGGQVVQNLEAPTLHSPPCVEGHVERTGEREGRAAWKKTCRQDRAGGIRREGVVPGKGWFQWGTEL